MARSRCRTARLPCIGSLPIAERADACYDLARSDGPMVTEPTRWGFGRQVIQQMPAQALTGNVMHEFLPHGVRWSLDIPATFLVDTQSSFANVRPYMRSRRKEVDQHVSQ